ncbi:unnamed protein product [Coregonus sp. 'balchen']|nr:unnamed protein product [Coregonus sp. 'balchen']
MRERKSRERGEVKPRKDLFRQSVLPRLRRKVTVSASCSQLHPLEEGLSQGHTPKQDHGQTRKRRGMDSLKKELEEELKLSADDLRSHAWYHGPIHREVNTHTWYHGPIHREVHTHLVPWTNTQEVHTHLVPWTNTQEVHTHLVPWTNTQRGTHTPGTMDLYTERYTHTWYHGPIHRRYTHTWYHGPIHRRYTHTWYHGPIHREVHTHTWYHGPIHREVHTHLVP